MGGTCVIVASGETAGQTSLEETKRYKTIAVNDAWRLCPWAGYLYACDGRWWDYHVQGVRRGFDGECWTQDRRAAAAYGLYHIKGEHKAGLSRQKGLIYFNKNSGAQAINLAYLWGARKIVLVGFDMQGKHFFGDHPPGVHVDSPYDEFIRNMGVMAADLASEGVDVINTSPCTALRCFRRMDLAEALKCEPSSRSGMSQITDESLSSAA